MLAPLEKLIEWSAIQIVTLMIPANPSNPRLDEAIQFLKGPDFVPIDFRLWTLDLGLFRVG